MLDPAHPLPTFRGHVRALSRQLGALISAHDHATAEPTPLVLARLHRALAAYDDDLSALERYLAPRETPRETPREAPREARP